MKTKPKKKTKPIELQARNMAKPKRRHGPEAERLKTDLTFEQAVDKALARKRPAKGWPK